MPLKTEELNKLHIAFDNLILQGQAGIIDTILQKADVDNMDQEMMIAYLDATLNHQNVLEGRREFYERCEEALKKRSETPSRKFQRLV